MKKAFTLAEALMSIAIIGVVAALILPAINTNRADETKMKYLKAFDSLTEMVQAIASNKREYPVCAPDFISGFYELNFEKFPLLNIEKRVQGSYSSTHRQDKLCRLLAYGYNDSNPLCEDVATIQNDFIQPGNALWKYSFKSNDGTEWTVKSRIQVSSLNITAAETIPYGQFGYNIVIDTNGADKAPNCLYNANNCPHPDRFWFMITADAKVTPADPMGKAYIKTRKNPTARNIDMEGLVYTQWVNGDFSAANSDNEVSAYIEELPYCE